MKLGIVFEPKTELSYSEIALERAVSVKILRAKVNFLIFTC